MVHTFPYGVYPKVNVIARLEFELTFYDAVLLNVSNYAMRTPHLCFSFRLDGA